MRNGKCDFIGACFWSHPEERLQVLEVGLGFGVWGLGFRVWGLGFRVWDGCSHPKRQLRALELSLVEGPISLHRKP